MYDKNSTLNYVKDVLKPELESPRFKIKDLDDAGVMLIYFSQIMRKVEELSVITDEVFALELIIDESNMTDDASLIEFTWTVI